MNWVLRSKLSRGKGGAKILELSVPKNFFAYLMATRPKAINLSFGAMVESSDESGEKGMVQERRDEVTPTTIFTWDGRELQAFTSDGDIYRISARSESEVRQHLRGIGAKMRDIDRLLDRPDNMLGINVSGVFRGWRKERGTMQYTAEL